MRVDRLDGILDRLPGLTVGLVGDFFLDHYLDLDASLTERSLETGLDAYQAVRIRNYPGAGGTVAANLRALGVGEVIPFTVVGKDEHGFALRQELAALGISTEHVIESGEILTPTYTKPMLFERGKGPGRELDRIDVKNRRPLPRSLESAIIAALRDSWPRLDALVAADQVQERDTGVITGKVRETLADLGAGDPSKPLLADSRARIGEFRNVMIKPNEREARAALSGQGPAAGALADVGFMLEKRNRRPVFITRGEKGIALFHNGAAWDIPAMRVEGPVDIVGAGDSATAGIVGSLAAGASPVEAGTIGCLAASITIQALGVTGTASPDDVRRRLREYGAQGLGPAKAAARESVS